MKKILITGGAGYIGSNVVKLLAEKNYEIFVVDNFSNSFSFHIENLIKNYPEKIKLFKFDIKNAKKLKNLFKNCKFDAVLHLAGKKYIPESFKLKDEYFENNVVATQILLDTMSEFQVKKLVFPSSLSVYGMQKKFPIKEESLLNPQSPYAENKAENEKMIEKWAKQNNAKAIVLRLSNPLGADTEFMLGDHSTKGAKGVLNYLLNCAEKNATVFLNGGNHPTKDGTTIRNYVHVSDVAKAFCLALEKDISPSNFLVLNIGSELDVSVLDLLHAVGKCSEKTLPYEFKPSLEGDVDFLISDITKAKNLLNFSPSKSLIDMVSDTKKFREFLRSLN